MEEIRFKINSEEKEYTLDDCPVDITHVNYIVFPILNKKNNHLFTINYR